MTGTAAVMVAATLPFLFADLLSVRQFGVGRRHGRPARRPARPPGRAAGSRRAARPARLVADASAPPHARRSRRRHTLATDRPAAHRPDPGVDMTTAAVRSPDRRHRQAPQTLPAVLRAAIASHSGVAMRSPDPRDPDALSYADVGRAADEIADGLAALGMQAGDRVAILASTRAEWALADLGALWAGATVVPIYNTNSAEECQYVLAHSGSRVVFCEDAAQLAKIDSVGAQLPRPRAPRRPHGLGAGGDDPGRPARARARPGRAGRRRAHRGRAARRRGHDRLHVGHDRAAEGLHAHARQHAGHDRPLPGPAGAGRRAWSPTSSCRSPTSWPA